MWLLLHADNRSLAHQITGGACNRSAKVKGWSLQFLLRSTGWSQHFTKCQKIEEEKVDSAVACCGWLDKAFPGDYPGRQACFLQTTAACAAVWSFTQSRQRSLKASKDMDIAKGRRTWDVQPLILWVTDMWVDLLSSGELQISTAWPRGVNIRRSASEPAESLRLEKQISGTLSSNLWSRDA